MAVVTARIKVKGKHFETHVNLDEALKLKAGNGDILSASASKGIYYDVDKGTLASKSDLNEAFGTEDNYEIVKTIILKGEVQKTQEFRDEEKEKKIKQIIAIIVRNAVDQHGRPYTEDRIKRAIGEIHFSFDKRTAEQQVNELIEALKKVIPIRVETKRIKIIIPAQFSGQVYAVIKDYKEIEEWLPNGSLQAILNIPSGMQLDFYDKLNHITHGAVQSEELKG